MQRILIVGGSTRAAAASARRAGLQPVCADLFADLDTRQMAEVIPVRKYPFSLPDDVANAQADGWFYTGGLENHPDLIERLDRPDASYGPLLGTGATTLRRVRDPFWWGEILTQSGIRTLPVLPGTAPPVRDGTWIRKPIASAGGMGVQVWDRAASDETGGDAWYFQARVEGITHSAVFHRGLDGLELLGMTQQVQVNDLSCAAEPFQYCGSIGPLDAASIEVFRRVISKAATALVSQCDLRGLFGIDFIPDAEGYPWILEVNPRYTASVEVLEYARQTSLLKGSQNEFRNEARVARLPVVAKAILYADESFRAPSLAEEIEVGSEWDLPKVADVPLPGSFIEATWPICTVMASGLTRESCLKSLRERSKDLRNRLKSQTSDSGHRGF